MGRLGTLSNRKKLPIDKSNYFVNVIPVILTGLEVDNISSLVMLIILHSEVCLLNSLVGGAWIAVHML